MPSYTISIPPHINFLKQYITEKNMKLLIYPKKINDRNSLILNSEEKIIKLNRILSADKNLLKKLNYFNHSIKSISTLNRGRYIKGVKNYYPLKEENKRYQHQSEEYLCSGSGYTMSFNEFDRALVETFNSNEDLNEIICYYNIS
jgi:hypothetical protein